MEHAPSRVDRYLPRALTASLGSVRSPPARAPIIVTAKRLAGGCTLYRLDDWKKLADRRSNRLQWFSGAVVMLSAVFPTHAGAATVSEVITAVKANEIVTKSYLLGELAGIEVMNAIIAHDGESLYCKPKALVITPEHAADILERHIEKYPFDGNLLLEAVMPFALKEVFPCPATKP